jgi:hypothetical protein
MKTEENFDTAAILEMIDYDEYEPADIARYLDWAIKDLMAHYDQNRPDIHTFDT